MKPLARCPQCGASIELGQSCPQCMLPLGLTVSATVTRLELDEHLPDVWSSAETAPITAAGQGQSLLGRRLGPYAILSLAGRGGMGEVYRALDTRLDRIVAVKVLPQEPAQQAERRKRFEREARAVSSLNHPHICTLYDVGSHDGIDFLVMEFVEGETLAHRLKKGPLSFDQVLRYAIQMTDALSDAHRHAIMHRDLKPGNIMLAKSGAKLLDFGLAKMLAATRPREAATIHADTETLTQKQTIVGTLAYMAPEQLDGAEADVRSDIFALGAVIFEMATGRRAFDAKNRADLVASIKTANPPSILTFHNMAHPALDYTVRTCLAKDPDARWQSSHDVLLELKRIGETSSQIGVGGAASPPTPKLRHRRIFSAVGSVAAVCVAIAFFLHSQAPPPARPSKFALLPPGEFEAPVISFDGRHIAYVLLHSNDPTNQRSGGAEETTRRLYVQDLDHEKPREIEGSEGAHLPFWSFDSKFIAFAARNHMWKANVGAGTPIPICDISSEFLGGTWSLDGRSVIFSAHRQGIYEVSAGGGTPRMLVPEDQSTFGQHFDTPKLLPASTGGRELLYATVQKNAAIHDIVVQSLASGTRRLLVPAANRPVYSPSGHVLYVSLADNNIQLLMALPFSLSSMTATGDAFPIVQSGFTPLTTAVSPSVSTNGTLVYKAVEHAPVRLVWRDLLNQVASPGPAELLTKYILFSARNMSLSADGHSLVLDASRANGGRELWIVDIAHGTATRLPSSADSDEYPIWNPTGTEITFRSNRQGYWGIYRRSADSSVEGVKLLVPGPLTKKPTDWSPDGRFLMYDIEDPTTRSDLWYLTVYDGGDHYEATPYLHSPAAEYGGKFSPDGQFVAYVSDKSGTPEVYIRRFPDDGALPRQISENGGAQPVWARNGKRLFFLEGDMLVSVAISTKPQLSVGERHRLFKSPLDVGYVVSANGERVLSGEPWGTVPPPFIRIVENWFAEFRDGMKARY